MIREPYSLEAEQGVLGAMMIDPSLIDALSADLLSSDFHWQDNADVFSAIVELRSTDVPVDFLTVAEKIGGKGAIAMTAELQRSTPSAANAMTYARIVKERSTDRALIAAAQRIHEIAHDSMPTADKVSAAQSEMLAIDGKSATPEISSAKDVMRKHLAELERRKDLDGRMDGLETGIKGLDKRLMGLKAEQLIVIAGRAKMGKTTLAMGIVRHVGIRQKKNVLVISLEMSNGGLMDRMLAAEGGVPLGSIKSGGAPEEYPSQINAASWAVINSGIYLSERPGLSISRIRSMARRHKMTHGLDLLVIDHIGLVDGEPGLITPLQKISEITRQSKLLAKELKIPVIILSQLNRSLESRPDKRPMPSDLRDSGSIEQDCDLCLFVYRDEVYNPNSEHKGIAEVIIGISRDTEQGTEYCKYEGEFNRITDLDAGQHVRPIDNPMPARRGM